MTAHRDLAMIGALKREESEATLWGLLGGDTELAASRRTRRRELTVIAASTAAVFLALVVAGAIVAVPGVERHLASDVRGSLRRSNPDILVRVSGRTVRLEGSVETPEGLDALRRRVSSRWGVDGVDLSRVVVGRQV